MHSYIDKLLIIIFLLQSSFVYALDNNSIYNKSMPHPAIRYAVSNGYEGWKKLTELQKIELTYGMWKAMYEDTVVKNPNKKIYYQHLKQFKTCDKYAIFNAIKFIDQFYNINTNNIMLLPTLYHIIFYYIYDDLYLDKIKIKTDNELYLYYEFQIASLLISDSILKFDKIFDEKMKIYNNDCKIFSQSLFKNINKQWQNLSYNEKQTIILEQWKIFRYNYLNGLYKNDKFIKKTMKDYLLYFEENEYDLTAIKKSIDFIDKLYNYDQRIFEFRFFFFYMFSYIYNNIRYVETLDEFKILIKFKQYYTRLAFLAQ